MTHFDVATRRRDVIRKDRPETLAIPEVTGDGDSITFVSDLSYVTYGNDPLSYRIDTFDANKLLRLDDLDDVDVRDRSDLLENVELIDASELDDEDEYRIEVFRGGKGQDPRIELQLKTFELPSFVEARRFYAPLMHKSETFVRHVMTVPEGHEAVAITEVLEYESGGKPAFQYAARTIGCGRELVFVAFSDSGNNRSRVLFRVTILHWPQGAGVTIPSGPMLFAVSGRESRGGGTKIRDFTLDEAERYVTTPTMYVTKGRRFEYETFGDAEALLAGTRLGDLPFEEVEDAISAEGVIGDVSAAVAGFFDENVTQIAENLTDLTGDIIDEFRGGGEQDFGLELTSLSSPDRTSVKFELSPESGAGTNAFGEATVWPMEFPPRVIFTPDLIADLDFVVFEDEATEEVRGIADPTARRTDTRPVGEAIEAGLERDE